MYMYRTGHQAERERERERRKNDKNTLLLLLLLVPDHLGHAMEPSSSLADTLVRAWNIGQQQQDFARPRTRLSSVYNPRRCQSKVTVAASTSGGPPSLTGIIALSSSPVGIRPTL